MIEWTGERYVPWMEEGEIHYEHLHRYQFAKEFVKGKKVLDLACGEGYGSFILAEEANEVIGIDIDEATIRHASSKYIKENLGFIKGSITNVPIKGENIFDVVVCFEAIEHIEEHDKLMEEVERLLKADGIFVVSTPNKYMYSDQPKFQNPFHLKELYFDEFKKLLSKYFENILIYGQKVYPSSNIFPFHRESGLSKDFVIEKGDKEFLFLPPEKKLAKYFIAVASDSRFEQTELIGDSHLIDISEILFRQKDIQISHLEGLVREREAEAGGLRAGLAEKEREIGNLKEGLRQKDAQISHLEGLVREREAALNHIYNSHGWKFLLKYYAIRDKLLREGTRRRAMMKLLFRLASFISGDSIRKVIRYARLYGIKGLFRKINAKLRYNHTYNIQTKPVSVPVIPAFEFNVPEDNIPSEDVKISVIIPTKDAGEEFDHTLRMLKKQKWIRDIELIVVDSGSSDKTLEIARKYDAHIISIQPDEFSHSAARNLGAEKASGSFLFFTVQDAILPSERFLYEFYRALKENDVVAVSCVEFCKENSDLIYSAMAWYHAHFLGVDKADRILSLPEKETHVTLRQNAQLSNTACFVRKDIFDQYRFRFNYAEDLDLGVRLIKDGYKLALLGSVRIIHSQNRPAYYYLKRGYVDSRYLTKFLPDFPVPVIRFEHLIRDIVTSYNLLNEFVKEDLLSLHTPCTLDHFMEFVKERFKLKEKKRRLVKSSINDKDYVDGNFKDFVEGIRRQLPEEETASLCNGILWISLLNFNETVFAFMKNTYDIFDDFILEEFIQCLYKAFALLCGSHIAYCELKAAKSEHMLSEIIAKLCQGL